MDNNGQFEYTYSAKQRSEIENIRKKYLPKEETKMERLRRLDKSAERFGRAISIAVGVTGTLIMGFGMCCVMVWNEILFGIIVGILGMAIIGAAYPIFNSSIKRRREKIAPEILKLTEEIEKSNLVDK